MNTATITAIEKAKGEFIAVLTGYKLQTTDSGPRCTITLIVEGQEANEVAHNLARLRRGRIEVTMVGYKEAQQLRLWDPPLTAEWQVRDDEPEESDEAD